MKRRTNGILEIFGGVAYVDVSTPRYPDTVTQIDEHALALMFDGGRGWGAQFNRRLYVARGTSTGRLELLHRKILGVEDPAVLVDHKDRNGLNNCSYNLRQATSSENARNKKSKAGSTSTFLGVYWSKQHAKWRATREWEGTKAHLGLFDSEEEAARAYDEACKGDEFANLNFPKAA